MGGYAARERGMGAKLSAACGRRSEAERAKSKEQKKRSDALRLCFGHGGPCPHIYTLPLFVLVFVFVIVFFFVFVLLRYGDFFPRIGKQLTDTALSSYNRQETFS